MLQNTAAYVSEVRLSNLHDTLQSLLFDAVLLLREYEDRIHQRPTQFTIQKAPNAHPVMLGHLVNHLVFGQDSFYSYSDLNSSFAVAAIRTAVELRLRYGFGVLSLFNKDTSSVEPLPLNSIFEVVRKRGDEVMLAVPLSSIERVYAWSNIYIHTGAHDYLWKTIFVSRCLFPLLAGVKDNRGWSIYNGIQLSREVLDQIHRDLLSTFGSERYRLVTVEAQASLTEQ